MDVGSARTGFHACMNSARCVAYLALPKPASGHHPPHTLECLPSFLLARVQLRGSRPWSAPPLGSPRPTQIRAREEEKQELAAKDPEGAGLRLGCSAERAACWRP